MFRRRHMYSSECCHYVCVHIIKNYSSFRNDLNFANISSDRQDMIEICRQVQPSFNSSCHRAIFLQLNVKFSKKKTLFMPPAWKVCRGHLVFGSSVRLSVGDSVTLISKLQYLKFGWSYSNQTWTVRSSKGCSQITDITCPLGWGIKM